MTTVDSLKSQAKRLRKHFAFHSITITHSMALEAIAASHGFADWNTASALCARQDGHESEPHKACPLADDDLANHMLDQAIIAALPGLNINQYLGKGSLGKLFAGGWTSQSSDTVVVLVNSMIEQVQLNLPTEAAGAFQENMELAEATIRAGLIRLGLLITEHKSIESEAGLFGCKVGQQRFSPVYVLSKPALDVLAPELTAAWGNADFRIRIDEYWLNGDIAFVQRHKMAAGS